MLKTIHTIAMLLLLGGLFAQTTITTNYLPQIGDSLKFSTADPSGFSTITLQNTGGPYVWDLNGLTAAGSSIQVFESLESGSQDDTFSNADAKLSTGLLATNYYTIDNNGMALIGTIGAIEIFPGFEVSTAFSPAYIERRATLGFIDQNSMNAGFSVAVPTDSLPQAILDAGGIVLSATDSIRLQTQINRTELVDAYGTAELGDQTFDVLREYRQEIRSAAVEAYVPFFGWRDITDALTTALPQIGELLAGQDTITSYTLWSDNSIDPIAVIYTDRDGETINNITYKTVETTSSTDDVFGANTEIRMYPNPARTISTFEATGLQSGIYQLSIHNVAGRKMINETHNVIGSELRSVVDVSKLPSALYLYSLTNSRGRILATKRLFVGGR